MAQLSTDTLAYTQIISKVQKFINDYYNLKNVSPKDYDKAYQELLFDIHKNIGSSMTEPIVFKKGEVPSSDIFNKFVSNLSADLNIITNQFDSLAANYINTFNLFSNQIEAEKAYLSRVKSKINILEIYSKSTSVNITYFGDSFNDLSMIESSKITPGFIPDVSDGYATLAKNSASTWRSQVRIVNQNYNNSVSNEISFVKTSNGLKGNSFIFENDGNKNMFLYEKDSSILRSNENTILDQSAATYFEYEAINVMSLNDPSSSKTRPEYEFEYLDNGKYINWGKFDTLKPLSLTLEFTSSSKTGEYINTISILPFFGYDIQGANALIKNIKVTSIKLFDEAANKTYELINSGPVTIASDIGSKTIDNYKNFFSNKGVFKFDETKANKVYITLEQSEFNETLIKHAYWTPYEVGSTQKWNNQSRFNPSALIDSSIVGSSWDKNLVVPRIDRPSEHKSSASEIRQVAFTKSETVTGQTKYQIKLQSGTQSYYWHKRDVDLNIDLFCLKDKANSYPNKDLMNTTVERIINGIPTTACVLVDPSTNIQNQLSSLKIKMKTIQNSSNVATVTTVKEHGLSVGSKVYIRDKWGDNIDTLGIFNVIQIDSTTQFRIKTSNSNTIPVTNIEQNYGVCLKVIDTPSSSNMSVETSSDTVLKSSKVFLNLKRNFEYLKAKRASIGIRDISIGRETYQDNAEIVSKPFFVNGQLDLLSLEVSEYISKSDSDNSSIKYYVSVDGGKGWIQISPIERGFKGLPEILAFNQNLSDNLSIPQIAYYNQPDVPNPINSIIFRAILKKNKSSNSTPILYWYKLGARIVQS
jgi:hypothetical protein